MSKPIALWVIGLLCGLFWLTVVAVVGTWLGTVG